MQGDGEMEEADYKAQCQAEAEAEGEAMAGMVAEAENEVRNEEIKMEEEARIAAEEMCSLYDFREAIIKLEGVKIPFDIIKHHIMPLREWLDSILPKREGSENG